jgi:hypothetical protein
MKTFSTIAIASLALAAIMSAPAYGQDDDVRSRGLVVQYQNGTIDGMQVSILKKSGTGRVPVDPGTTFKEGDQIWVSFASNFEGYVYIVNVMPDGQKRVLFPYQTYQTGADSQTSNLLHADQRYILPKGDAFAFDEHTGTETLQVIMSRDPIPYLEAAVKNPNGDLGNSASSAAAELQGKAAKQSYEGSKPPDSGGIVTDNVAVPEGVQTRDIRRVTVAHSSAAPPAPARATQARARHRVDKQGSVVAIPDEGGKGGKLKAGEIAVFEIRLKHV